MNNQHEMPVVLGSSASGLLVSLSLSKAGVDHLLIGGGEPPSIPRLGESLNECASPELWRQFGQEFKQYFYIKSHISLLNGDYATQVHVGNPNRKVAELSRYAAKNGQRRCHPLQQFRTSVSGRTLLHLDRIPFDQALYHKVKAQACCHFVEQLVDRVELDAASDEVARLVLRDGSIIERPKYVFDTTGFRGLIAEAAGVKTNPISDPQRVVWSHYYRSGQDEMQAALDEREPWWRYGTNLLRLCQDADGVDGISWLIPLGDTISVGISVDADRWGQQEVDKETILNLMTEAYERRGICYREKFPEIRPPQDLVHRYYVRDRAYGANWLLVGGTFVTVWFPSSAGLWTTMAAADMAPRIIEDPERYGSHYESVMRTLLPFHDHLESMIHGEPFRSVRDAYVFWDKWFAEIPSRLAQYMEISYDNLGRRRPIIWYLHTLSRIYRRFPRLLDLTWTFATDRIQRQADLGQQAGSFPGYFKTLRYRTANYFRGLRYMLTSLLPGGGKEPSQPPSRDEHSSDKQLQDNLA